MKRYETPFNDALESISSAIARTGSAGAHKSQLSNFGLESISEAAQDGLKAAYKSLADELAGEVIGLESLAAPKAPKGGDAKTPWYQAAMEESARTNALATLGYVALAAGDPVAYARHALEGRWEGTAGAPLVVPGTAFGSAGSMGYMPQGARPAMEAYDNKNLTEFLPFSIAFNVEGQRQDEFAELLFKTSVVPPEQAGVEIAVSRLLVYRDQNHTNKSYYNMGKKNLIDAHVDHTILQDLSTKVVPVAATDGSNDAYLVPDTLVPTTDIELAGVSVPTRPYLIGQPLDLLALSQYQPLVGLGVQFDNQDAIDGAVRLTDLVIDTGVSGAPGIVVSVRNFGGDVIFQRDQSGNYRGMHLNFGTRNLVLNAATVAADGSAVASLAAVVSGNYTVTLGVSVSARYNVEKANLETNTSKLQVTAVYDANGVSQSLTSGIGQQIVTALAGYSIAGFDIDTRRTNSNRRTAGLRIDCTLVRERYYIPLSSPLSVARPNEPWQNQQAVDLEAIVTAARIRNTNNAITALFNIAADLKAAQGLPDGLGQDDSGTVGGLGRLLIKRYYNEMDLDLTKAINLTDTSDKAEAVSAVLVNAIRDQSFTMLQQTNMQPALEARVGGNRKPILFVGTDQRLIRHLMVTGDTRTFTPMFDTAIVKESLDSRMYNKIVLTFIRPEATGPDPLSFGAHLWSTELVSTLQVTRDGESNSIETMVQPRTLHVNMCPILSIINVSGLEEVLTTAMTYTIAGSIVTSHASADTGTGG